MKRIEIRHIFRIYPKGKIFFYKRFNKLYFWLNGIRFGHKMVAYNKIYVRGNGKVVIGDNFIFKSDDNINPVCRNIRGAIYTMTPNSLVEIGDNVGISSACIWAKEKIYIGNNVNIGGDCLIMDNDAHPHDYLKRRSNYIKEVGWNSYLETIPTAPIVVEDDVWIGARCIILKGVHIGARSIIAAGSVVTKDIPSDSIAGGNPCRILRKM